MNTKKVIELVKQAFGAWESEYCCGDEESKALYDELEQVVTVIEQGEKYKKMWGELCDRNVNDSDEYVYSWTEELFELMVNIQQKYFPEKSEETYNGVPVSEIKVGGTD